MKNFIVTNQDGEIVISHLTEAQQIEAMARLLKNGFVEQRVVVPGEKVRFYLTKKGKFARDVSDVKR